MHFFGGLLIGWVQQHAEDDGLLLLVCNQSMGVCVCGPLALHLSSVAFFTTIMTR